MCDGGLGEVGCDAHDLPVEIREGRWGSGRTEDSRGEE